MNKVILKKAIDELNADKPRLDYIKGLLETLYELVGEAIGQTITAHLVPTITPSITTINEAPLTADESAALDALAKSKLEFVKKGSVIE